MKKIRITLLFTFVVAFSFAQSGQIGQWKDYLPYNKGVSVACAHENVYCAAAGGLFVLSRADNSMEHLSRVNGFSDIEATHVKYNPFNNKVIVVYKNTNIDLINGKSVSNIPDIKNKPLFGNKAINNVYLVDQYAYLASTFGIVVLDMNKEEIKDFYNVTSNNTTLNIRDISADDQNFYVATDSGVFIALRTANLSNYNSWSKMPGLPTGIYNGIATLNGKIYASLSTHLTSNLYRDEVYVYENSAWSLFSKLPTSFGYEIRDIRNVNGKLLITADGLIFTYDDASGTMDYFSGFSGNLLNCFSADIDDDGALWVADKKFGLLRNKDWQTQSFYPSGPLSANVNSIYSTGEDLWLTPGGLNPAASNSYTIEGISTYSNGQWTNIKGPYQAFSLDTIFDILEVAVDPTNPKRAYASSFGCGLLEFKDKKPEKIYDLNNSPLSSAFPGDNKFVRTSGLAFDSKNNLWIGNSNVANVLVVKQQNGAWKTLDFSFFKIPDYPVVTQVLIDKNDQKWIVGSASIGLAVYKGGANDIPSLSTNTKKLTIAEGNGHLPSSTVVCLAEDKNGEIWVGTDKGIAVFYNPGNVFSGQNFDAQTIKIEQDGNIQILLETETVQAIAIDAGNRKWIGTSSSGVYLMSADGTKQIHHFDEKNSPLISNNVKSIGINPTTGEVFFGTPKGMVSFQGDAIEGLEYFENVYAYPNPVKDNYEGPIVIKGLVNNTTLKITDISGTLVSELTSLGGQAIWNRRRLNGERVSSGVYMVFCTNEDGSQKIATKILVIN